MQKINFEDKPNTTTPLSADNLNDLQDNVENAINLVSTYSTTETVIGKWIDNKPIYRKTISCGALPNASQKTVAHNISNLKKVINAYGMSERANSLTWLPVNSNRPEQATDGVGMFVDNVNINLFTAIDRTSFTNTYVIIEYTKTTD